LEETKQHYRENYTDNGEFKAAEQLANLVYRNLQYSGRECHIDKCEAEVDEVFEIHSFNGVVKIPACTHHSEILSKAFDSGGDIP